MRIDQKYNVKEYINYCITFYDDTVSKIFEFKWVKIRALDEDGNLDDRCWSNVGSITEASQQSFQEINLSPKGCLFTKTIQVKHINISNSFNNWQLHSATGHT